MKITKNVMCDIPVTVNLTAHDIEVIYLAMEPDDLPTYLKQLNDVAIFIKGTPIKVIHQLNEAQAKTIAIALGELANLMLANCNGGLGTSLENPAATETDDRIQLDPRRSPDGSGSLASGAD